MPHPEARRVIRTERWGFAREGGGGKGQRVGQVAYSTRQEATLLGTLKLNAPLPHLLGVVWGVSVPQVNGQNVVKVGHRQVVNMIRQGGNTLMVKVVMVTRHPDMDEAVHKKGAPPHLCGQAWHSTATRLRPSETPMAGVPFPKAVCS